MTKISMQARLHEIQRSKCKNCHESLTLLVELCSSVVGGCLKSIQSSSHLKCKAAQKCSSKFHCSIADTFLFTKIE